jgi:hypothetical protein
MGQEWNVHPNRSELGPDKPGRNGHYRTVVRVASRLPKQRCEARVVLPKKLSRFGDPDGSVTFDGSDWRFVTAAARSFAADHTSADMLPPFGFSDNGQWWWWDGSTTDYSILETLDAGEHVRRYLQGLFPGAAGIEVADLR